MNLPERVDSSEAGPAFRAKSVVQNSPSGWTVDLHKVPEDSRFREADVFFPPLYSHPGIANQVGRLFQRKSRRVPRRAQASTETPQMSPRLDDPVDNPLYLPRPFNRE